MIVRKWIPSALLMLCAPLLVHGVDPAPEAKTGIKIGEKSPEFTLKDQSGKERSLNEFLKKGKVALVFHRSAEW